MSGAMDPIYLDNAATTPLAPEVRAAMSNSFGFGGSDAVLVVAQPERFAEQECAPARSVVVGAVATLELDAQGLCARAVVTLFGVGGVPARANAAEEAMRRERPTADRIRAAASVAAAATAPRSDTLASADYRRHLVRVLTERALSEAADRAVSPA